MVKVGWVAGTGLDWTGLDWTGALRRKARSSYGQNIPGLREDAPVPATPLGNSPGLFLNHRHRRGRQDKAGAIISLASHASAVSAVPVHFYTVHFFTWRFTYDPFDLNPRCTYDTKRTIQLFGNTT